MKNLLLLLSLFWSTLVFSQDEEKSSVMTTQTGGRYEILQSQLSPIYTFRLDKHAGKVFIFVQVPGEPKPYWLELPGSFPAMDTQIPDKINYQLFLGGINLGDCYLLNIHTGVTWILKKNSNGRFSFEHFETLFTTKD